MANIHVVPTFHHDIAYLQPESVYTQMATNILDKALTLMEQDETYTFTVEQAYFFREYFEKHPENHAKLTEFAQKGQLQFAPCCKDAIREFSLYRWESDGASDRVCKEHDHAMDDIRYFCATILRRDRQIQQKLEGEGNEKMVTGPVFAHVGKGNGTWG